MNSTSTDHIFQAPTMDTNHPHLFMYKPVKRSRKVMTLEKKLNVLDRLACGESAASIARELRVNESTIRTIKRSDAAIRASVARGQSKNSKVRYVHRDRNLERMERALNVWIDEQVQKGVPLITHMICEMARQFYKVYVEKYGTYDKDSTNGNLKELNFKASKGWFENFKKRYSMQKVKFFGGETSFANKETVEVLEHLKSVVQDGYFEFEDDDSGFGVRQSFTRVLDALEKDPSLPVPQYWKNFNITECLGDIRASLEETKPLNLNACWRIACATAEVRRVMLTLGDEEDVGDESAAVATQPESSAGGMGCIEEVYLQPDVLIKEEVEDVPEEDALEEDVKVANEEVRIEEAIPTLQDLNKGMMMAFNLAEFFQEMDPNAGRGELFKRGLESLLEPYKVMWQGYFDDLKS